ncbi:MAG: mannose-1-phosphate guanylyltransferase, partial [Pseudomonadota bacterium]
MTVYPVILAGGRGTRLWPLSRSDKPKQFLPMHGDKSLFQRTVERHAGLPDMAQPWVVCGENDRFQVDDALDAINVADATVVVEPCSRNTAPAIATVAQALVTRDPEAILFVLPSDHLITTDPSYFETLEAAFAAAKDGKMVTFGVVPTYPETGYGYIKGASNGSGEGLVRGVANFVEKPPMEEAARMVADGDYYWNAGFFAFSAQAVLDELDETAPAVSRTAREAVAGASSTNTASLLPQDAYAKAPDISIDYALFERTKKETVAPISCRWSDVGSWRAYWETLDKDEAGNAVRGKGTVVDSKNSLIVGGRADVIALGVEDLAIVAADDAILVCPLDRAQ